MVVAAATEIRRLPLFFLFRKVAMLEFEADGSDEGWKLLESAGSRLNRLTISHVTTKKPAGTPARLSFSHLTISDDLGKLLFTTYGPETLYAVCEVPRVGRLYITGHQGEDIQLLLVQDRSVSMAGTREYHLVFDLDETLIYNPHLAGHVPGSEFVNPHPPHFVNEPIDTPRMRPNLQPFLQLVCPYFDQVRICTMSMRQRANPVIALLDPQQRTLLKNARNTGKVVVCREDMQVGGNGYPWIASAVPPSKTLDHCNLPAGKENRTVILDDCWQIWAGNYRENLLAVVPPHEMGGMPHEAYMNGEDGGVLGKYILVCLINLALKEERRQDLIKTAMPVGLAASHPMPPSSYIRTEPYTASRSWGSSHPATVTRDTGAYKSQTKLRSRSAEPSSVHNGLAPTRMLLSDYAQASGGRYPSPVTRTDPYSMYQPSYAGQGYQSLRGGGGYVLRQF